MKKKKGIAILVNFSDAKFTYTQEDFNAFANEKGYNKYGAKGSVGDYFRDQSRGKFNVEFDVVGPIKLTSKQKSGSYNFGTSAGKSCSCKHIIRNSTGKLRNTIRCCRCDYKHISLICKSYMLHLPRVIAVKGICNTPVMSKCFKSKRRNELCGILSHDHIYIGMLFNEL